MIICAAGDIHGAIGRLYDDVLEFERSLGLKFDAVLHVGDFGVWPDRERVDRATREHEGAGDFPAWHAIARPVPRRTIFIKGNHEDFEWLQDRTSTDILPGLTYLANGDTLDVRCDATAESIRVGGIGGCFGPSNYERPSARLQGYARRHFTRDEVERLCAHGRVDILLLHDAPGGVEFVRRRGPREQHYVSEAAGLAEAVRRTRPRICLFGHHHHRIDAEIDGIRCIGLNKVARPGNLVAVDVTVLGDGCRVLGEWPARSEHAL
ncbi:MAG TPA: metallophosphoesterase [Polyangiales bacterium]|nr:metallophosphoesterase [Polyangiales bacterium]